MAKFLRLIFRLGWVLFFILPLVPPATQKFFFNAKFNLFLKAKLGGKCGKTSRQIRLREQKGKKIFSVFGAGNLMGNFFFFLTNFTHQNSKKFEGTGGKKELFLTRFPRAFFFFPLIGFVRFTRKKFFSFWIGFNFFFLKAFFPEKFVLVYLIFSYIKPPFFLLVLCVSGFFI